MYYYVCDIGYTTQKKGKINLEKKTSVEKVNNLILPIYLVLLISLKC